MEKGHWDINASATINTSQRFRYSDIIPFASVQANYLFLIYFSSPSIIQTNSSLALEVVQKYVHGWTRIMKTLCHRFIKSLTFRKKKKSAAIIASFLKNMMQLVDNNFIVIQCPIGIRFSTSLTLHCGFPRSQNKNKRLAIQEQKKSETELTASVLRKDPKHTRD